jgi:DNA invertase Pin-like site-specific DNA recombinase
MHSPRARALGWADVNAIDDDLGRSGGGTARPGFERLLAAICTGSAGAVLAIEAARLARNGRDWHTLLEFCTLVNTLIIDEDGVYDPKLTMVSYDGNAASKHIVYIIANFDDRLHEYADRYQHQIDHYVAGDPVPGLQLVVFDVKPPFYTAMA